MCAATPMRGCRPRRDVRVTPAKSPQRKKPNMKNFVAPLSFTIAAAWVVVLFVLVHSNS